MDTKVSSATDAIVALGFPPLVTETAIGLVEAWVRRYAEVDGKQTTLLVECPFVMEIDERALLVGIADRIAWSDEATVVFGCSWKTAKEPSQYWNERKWLEEMKRAAQWMMEAVAMKRGVWVTEQGLMVLRPESLPTTAFIIRAAVKTPMPMFWPEEAGEGVFELTETLERNVMGALRSRVAAVRAKRSSGELPWQLPGIHCIPFTTKYKCEFLGACEKGETSVPEYKGPVNEHDERVRRTIAAYAPGREFDVIMTPTNYMLGSNCIERWRRRLIYPTESSGPQSLGTAVHAGLAHFYANDLPCAKGEELKQWLSKV